MDNKTLLIAHSKEEFLFAICSLLEPRYHVKTCQDGKTALALLRRESFDLLLLDLMLPELDGISLLELAQKEGRCPPSLALTTLLGEYVEQSAQRLGVRYMVRPPCDLEALVSRMGDLLQMPSTPPPPDKRQYLSQQLLLLPMKASRDGYKFLLAGALSYYQHPDQRFSKELYPDIGAPTGHTGKQVERSIRSALDASWEIRNDEQWQLLFACGQERPTASQAIARLAELLRQLD